MQVIGRSAKTISIAAFIALLGCQVAQTCVVPPPVGVEFADAEVIVRAKVRSYKVVRYLEAPSDTALPGAGDAADTYDRRPLTALMEFDVIETIAGRPSRQSWTAMYSGHVEEEWKGPIQVIVGLHAKLDADGSAKIVAIPPPCSRWLLPDRPSYVEAVLSAVAGRPSRPGRFSDSTNNRFHQP